MYLKCQRPVNPNFSLIQLPINETRDLVYWKPVLLSRVAPDYYILLLRVVLM